MNRSAALPASLSKRDRRIIGALVIAVSILALFSSPLGETNPEQSNYTPSARRLLTARNQGHDNGNINAPPRKRLALIRPFSTHDGDGLLESFMLWDTLWPCTSIDKAYDVDLVLSYSRQLDDNDSETEMASAVVDAIRGKILEEVQDGAEGLMHWSDCFAGLRVIEANIHPSRDKYERDSHTGEPMSLDWVAGPNSQFRETLSKIMKSGEYELAMIMETDTQPQRIGWLDFLLEDIRTKAPFALLGSKYKGKGWEEFKDLMPRSLLEHINGNAVYNLTNPYFQKMFGELKKEAGTEWEAIPYDYRMSQIVHEGRYGTPPTFPFPWLVHDDGTEVKLASKKNKFRKWWQKYASSFDPIKESSVIANFAQGNYLESDIENNPALLHGLNMYRPWNPNTHRISLVVSAWNDPTEHNDLVQELDEALHSHPFKEVIIMENSRNDVFNNNLYDDKKMDAELPKTKSLPVQVRERVGADVTDVCNAPVTTEWFFYTNVYHRVVSKVDLLFSQDNMMSRPLVPYTPAESLHCSDYAACRETLRLAREIYPAMDKVILDMAIPYHTPSRDAFCDYWKANYGKNGELLKQREEDYGRRLVDIPLAPTATAFVAYLYKTGIAENVYSFTNVLVHGSRPIFIRVQDDLEAESEYSRPALKGSTGGFRKLKDSQEVRTRKLAKKTSPPPPSPTPPGPTPSPTPVACAAIGKKCANGKAPANCCEDLECGADTNRCEIAYYRRLGGFRKLSISTPGLLVEG